MWTPAPSSCFNPSCGLIGCGTATELGKAAAETEFQSLVRVDWLWNRGRFVFDVRWIGVSIPRAG